MDPAPLSRPPRLQQVRSDRPSGPTRERNEAIPAQSTGWSSPGPKRPCRLRRPDRATEAVSGCPRPKQTDSGAIAAPDADREAPENEGHEPRLAEPERRPYPSAPEGNHDPTDRVDTINGSATKKRPHRPRCKPVRTSGSRDSSKSLVETYPARRDHATACPSPATTRWPDPTNGRSLYPSSRAQYAIGYSAPTMTKNGTSNRIPSAMTTARPPLARVYCHRAAPPRRTEPVKVPRGDGSNQRPGVDRV